MVSMYARLPSKYQVLVFFVLKKYKTSIFYDDQLLSSRYRHRDHAEYTVTIIMTETQFGHKQLSSCEQSSDCL